MVLSGAGFGGAIWVLLAGILFKFADFKTCYWIMTALCLVIGLFAVFFLIKTPEQLHQSALQNFSYKPDSVNVRSLKIPFAAQQRATRGMTAYFISVGQGDSEYIELPNGKNVLIDGGPNSAGVSAFLKSKNVSTIDYLVLTHPHADHFSGLAYVFDNLQVNNFYDTMLAGRDKMIAALRALQQTHIIDKANEHPSLATLKISSGGSRGFLALLATHPPLEERIARLETMKNAG